MRIGQQQLQQQQTLGGEREDFLTSSASTSTSSQELINASKLASHVFFQLIRESPYHVSRTKSLPASYLSPSLIGTLWGLGMTTTTTSTARTSTTTSLENERKRILRETHGIKSNYIHSTEWTGVSLARWMDLLPPLPHSGLDPSSSGDRHDIKSHHSRFLPSSSSSLPLTSAVWLMTLWELCQSKHDFLECLLSLEAILLPRHRRIFDMSNPLTLAILNDQTARDEWADSTFCIDRDLSSDQVQASLEQVLQNRRLLEDYIVSTQSPQQTLKSSNDATALEILCATISLHHIPENSKPMCPTGYYGFDGGGIQADCAELTVREVLNLLLWDEERGRFNTQRLPSTASKRLYELYDETLYPFEESGGEWFNLLSDLPGCDYFLESPNGRPYELVPTISNVLRAIQILLYENDDDNGSRKQPTVESKWSSFEDLRHVWEAHKLQVHERTLTHRSSTSGELIHHEFATLKLEGSPSGIELRLRCDMNHMSGMSKVTHLRDRQPLFVDNKEGWKKTFPSETTMKQQMLGLCLGVDSMTSTKNTIPDDEDEWTTTLISILSTAYGCDRRSLLTVDILKSDQDTMNMKSEELLKSTILTLCQHSHEDPLVGHTLLPWILNETSTVFDGGTVMRNVDDAVEDAILKLPTTILKNQTLQDALEFHWAVDGKPMKAWCRWKSGHSTMGDEMRTLRLSHVPKFIKLVLTR